MSEPRSKRRRSIEREPCGEFHNPGVYPWLAACTLEDKHRGNHKDAHGNEWERYPKNSTNPHAA